MTLNKAIEYGKEHREQYRKSKLIELLNGAQKGK